MSDINMTYDLLFDILRQEKSRDDLQKIDEYFYANVVEYLNSKDSIINNPNTPIGEKELTRIQLGNVKKLLVELYDRREKKIINLSIYKIKTSSGMINTDGLLPQEKQLFEMLYDKLFAYRRSILYNVIEGKEPQALIDKPLFTKKNDAIVEKETVEDKSTGIQPVRFIKSVPRFLGPELETYGPFEENDIASLPAKIANVLVKKSRAEMMIVN